ncbi:MAG: hypothetical protein WCD76_05090 [Pyrinomonadaceae bacterium]
MADDNCLGEGTKKWTSKLTPTGGSPKDDGKIEIKKVSNQLKGKHEKSGADLEDLTCDGTNISFSRVETRSDGTRVRVKYKNGKISGPTAGKFFIDGKYEEVVLPAPPADKSANSSRAESATKRKSGLIDDDTGDWQAEKPSL